MTVISGRTARDLVNSSKEDEKKNYIIYIYIYIYILVLKSHQPLSGDAKQVNLGVTKP